MKICVQRPMFTPTGPDGKPLVWIVTRMPGKLRCGVYKWSTGRNTNGRYEGRGWVRCGFVDLPANTTWIEYIDTMAPFNEAELRDSFFLFAAADQVKGLLELFSIDSTMRPS